MNTDRPELFVPCATSLPRGRLVRHLIADGYQVKALARSGESARTQSAGRPDDIRLADLTNAFARQLRGAEILFRIAAHFRDSFKDRSHRSELFRVQMQAPRAPRHRDRSLRCVLFIVGLIAAGAPLHPQAIDQNDRAPTDPPPATVAASSSRGAGAYEFPDGRQQFRGYLNYAFGLAAFARAAVGAGLDQSKPAPPEWDTGAEGFGERYGFRFGMGLITESVKFSSGALLHEDVAYHRCDCSSFLARTAHAFVSPFTAKSRSGSTIVSLPSITAPYAGAFAAVNAFYPARYEPEDAARLGTYSFALSIGANLVREFALRSR